MGESTRYHFTEQLYDRFQRDPGALHPGWRRYFQEIEGTPRVGSSLEDAVAAPRAEPIRRPAAGEPEQPIARLDSPYLQHLEHVSLFRELHAREKALLAALVEPVTLAPEERLFGAGDRGDALYVVTRGALRVERGGKVLAVVGPGEVAGEMAVVDKKPRSADVIAHTRAELLKLPVERFDELIARNAEIARGLLGVLAQRLRSANAQQEKVDNLARSFRNRGHVIARLDPLGRRATKVPELDLAYHGLSEADLDVPFSTRTAAGSKTLSLRAILEKLHNTYCRSIGVQFMHIDDREVREWLQFRMEGSENRRDLSLEQQRRILSKLTDAEVFETFIHKKFLGAKRFSLEGGESLIPLLDMAIEEAAAHAIEELVIGMAHRGRLNVLANVMGKSPRRIFQEFKDADSERFKGGGDVKYHMGYSSDRDTASGRRVHLSLCFNPSHLEVVAPVVLGRVRAKQDRLGDRSRERVMGVVIHGDAAFAGQGVVQEILNMSTLPGYQTGGILHVIVNNQIGFTTEPEESRSSQYATDIARTLDTPIFHVNGEDPEAVAQVIELAMAFRARFRRDVVIDMYCYRRHGHNEGDEPTYTQPLMYRAIAKQPPVREGYLRHLREQQKGIGEDEAAAIAARSVARLEEELARAETGEAADEPEVKSIWQPYRGGPDRATPEVDTGVPRERLAELLRAQTQLPAAFTLHPKLKKLLEQRREMAEGQRPLDWAAAEALAFATLLAERTHVRLSGQDAERGTFTHRHAVLHDYENGTRHVPLQHAAAEQARFSVWNSPLSETGVLGFDWGYSLDMPEALVLWEAQFGDFANVAQVMIDQFIVSAEQKWGRLSGLVLLLPHGFEGQGPEHSSARLERFLAMAARDNIQVVSATTPAQIFHCLRRQVRRPWRKPLVLMSPKSLLRHPHAVSSLDELTGGRFQRVLADTSQTQPAEVRSILLCTGKVYYDLARAREERHARDVHVLRIEQLYPLPDVELKSALAGYPEAARVTWVQEEPRNMGAWWFLKLSVGTDVWGARRVRCVARGESASPATGSAAAHKREQELLVEQAFTEW
jgi:2-oxoglutarate dehydrogenase E1 component